jgi:SAM-dependent methyltransferase
MIDERWATATWVMGNNYRGSGYYGAYPPAYVPRIYSMFPESQWILHLFSGSLTRENVAKNSAEVRRLDLNSQFCPDYVRDAEDTDLPDQKFDLIMADPPYSHEDAEHYGKPLCNRNKVLAECHRILAPDGYLVWLDQSQPMYSKTCWQWVGVVSVLRSTNHRVRAAFFFQPA